MPMSMQDLPGELSEEYWERLTLSQGRDLSSQGHNSGRTVRRHWNTWPVVLILIEEFSHNIGRHGTCSEDQAETPQPKFAFVRHKYRPNKKMLHKWENVCFKTTDCAKYQIICTFIVPSVYEVQDGVELVLFYFCLSPNSENHLM